MEDTDFSGCFEKSCRLGICFVQKRRGINTFPQVTLGICAGCNEASPQAL